MIAENFLYEFHTSKKPEEIYQLLLDIKQWWSGLFDESIHGHSHSLDDEFSFQAGNGAHYSKQKLIALSPGKRIVWLVTDSKLDFLDKSDEWTGTKISFDISIKNGLTRVIFLHEGLAPQLACYNSCSGAWKNYLQKFEQKLNVV